MRAIVLLLLAACGGGNAEGPGPNLSNGNGGGGGGSHEVAPSPGVSIAWASESRKVDKIGSGDGAVTPDGKNDLVLEVEIDGPLDALFVASVTDKGEPTGDYQADTLVGNEQQPMELSLVGAHGKESAGLVAYENDKMLNATDGSLKISSGHHKLKIFASDHPSTKDGVRLFARKPDGTIVQSKNLK